MRRFAVVTLTVLLLLIACGDTRTPTEQAVAWWPDHANRQVARCIVWHESRGDPNAIGAAGEYGLFQLHPIHDGLFWAVTGKPMNPWAFNPALNGQVARVLYRQRGWGAWSSHGACGV